MKAKPDKKFTLKIIPEEMEYEGEHKDSFEGIYRVILNGTITIFFVPSGDYKFSSFPFKLAVDSIEEIQSKKDAALLTLMNSSYSVTSTYEPIPSSGYYYYEDNQSQHSSANLIFITDSFTISSLLLELDHLIEKQNELYPPSVLKYEDIENSMLVKFIEEKIIPNQYFKDYDKQILGR